ncbi:MAG: acyl carrier protein [Cryomorphaceae bacterium]|nr:MAG: acyl carrier protein [Cryomorphaceae bacterium]
MDALIEKLKGEIIQQLNLEEMTAADIETDAPLFMDGLGLDSIDALELIVLLERNYGIKLEDPKAGKDVFHSVRTMAEYIQSRKEA